MLQYSPLDQLKPNQRYPCVYLSASWHDTAVLYHEPAKFAAKLRQYGQDVVLRTLFDHGHSGSSGRFGSLVDIAEMYAFALHVMGIKE
jgi:oligopeptidase B